jgi:hypothetical protein
VCAQGGDTAASQIGKVGRETRQASQAVFGQRPGVVRRAGLQADTGQMKRTLAIAGRADEQIVKTQGACGIGVRMRRKKTARGLADCGVKRICGRR